IDRVGLAVALALACAAPEDGLVITPSPLLPGGTTGEAATTDAPGGSSASALPDLAAPDDTTDGAPLGAVVAAGSWWRYRVGVAEDGWRELGYDDSTWREGQAPLGFGYALATIVDPGAPPAITVYLRARFTAAAVDAIPGLSLHLRRDDGAIVWLNGVEVARSNMPEGPVTAATPADSHAEGLDGQRFFRAFAEPSLLEEGENVIAVEVHQRAADSDDLAFDLDLRPYDPRAPRAEVEVRVRTRDAGGEYSPRNVGAVWIERADGAFVRTLERWAAVREQHLVHWLAASGGDVVDAVTSATLSAHLTHVVTWDLRDAAGLEVSPGEYRVRVEFTERNSNAGDGPGEQLALPFVLGEGPVVVAPPDQGSFADLLLLGP
ncbi:MAG: DUF2271 domain-containing protein, partial [Myxococcales bacterium]|nr:DUF2271 domain-containing protein [Myxococcales bacterium]